MEKNKYQALEKIILIAVFSSLSFLFLFSIVIQYRQNQLEKSTPDPDQLIAYAKLFMKDQPRAGSGKLLDCSAYTRAVYKQFSLNIPFSAYDQYRLYGGLEPENLSKGDLVFFNTSGKGVSHVGIYIEEGIFLHSPGFNRQVRLDSLSNSYWEKRFISGGRVIFGDR